jgi:peptidoglycan/LPS O-acetylase OafA/YrhL
MPELDGVRGLAVAAVMLYHCFPCSITRGGWMGVDLFFVLSGFLITGILLDTKDNKKYYINFIGRRILRIFPLYYMVLGVILFVIPTFWSSIYLPHFSYYTKHQSWFWLYTQNWLYSRDGFPQNHLLVHFWTLGVEEQFYLLWPWAIRYIPRRHLVKASLILCIVAIVYRLLPLTIIHLENTYRYMSTIARMDSLLIGAIIAILIRDNKRLLEKVTLPLCILSFTVLLLGVISFRSLNFLDLPSIYTAIDVFCGSLLLLSLSSIRWVKKIVKQPFLIKMGKYSYGLYVYHYIIFIILRYNINEWLNTHFDNFSTRMLFLGTLTVILATGISILSYHYFESSFLKLKNHFKYTKDSRKMESIGIEMEKLHV